MRGLNNSKKRIIFCGILSLLTVAMVFCFPKSGTTILEESPAVPAAGSDVPLQADQLEAELAAVPGPEAAEVSPEDEAEVRFGEIVKKAVDCVESQRQVEAALLQELDSGIYTFQAPFVVLDPYNMAPLSALAQFITDKPAQISVHVPGDTPASEVNFTFDGYKTRHQVPIYGLYAERENTVELTAVYEDQRQEKSIIKIETAPLPEQISFGTYVTYIGEESKYQPGFNFLYDSRPTIKRAIDSTGEIRWFLSDTDCWYSGNYNHGNSVYLGKGEGERRMLIYELNYLGKVLNLYYGAFGAHHDIEVTDSGKLILTGGKDETVEDILYEIDLKTGKMINFLDYKEVLQRSRIYGVHRSNADWMHMNSAVEYEGDIIVSSNHQSTILRNSWDGQIKWMLADPTGYYKCFEQYLLTPIGEDFEYPYNQHAVEVLPDYDHNPNTIDIILFDNGTSRNAVNKELQRQIWNNEIVEPPLYSRMVHYRIDEKNMTVEQIWQYGKERPEIYSQIRGDADLLGNGNVLGCFNRTNWIDNVVVRDTVYTEVDPNKNVVWECFATSKRADNYFEDYRIERLEIYTEACNDLKIGTPANNLIPEEVLQKYA